VEVGGEKGGIGHVPFVVTTARRGQCIAYRLLCTTVA